MTRSSAVVVDDAERVADFRRACAAVLPFGLGAEDAVIAELLREIGAGPDSLRVAALLTRARPVPEIVRALREAASYPGTPAQGHLADLLANGRRRFAASAGRNRLAWSVLSVFHGLFSLAEAAAVLAACGVADGEHLLGTLVSEGVVIRTGDAHRMLFRLPAVYRAPARVEFVKDRSSYAAAQDALLEHWTERVAVDQDLWWAPRQEQTLAEIEAAIDDLMSIIDERGPAHPHAVLRLVALLLPFWMTTARIDLACSYLIGAIDDPDIPTDLRDDALYALGWLEQSPRDQPRVEQALADRCAVGGDVARFEQARGMSALYRGDAPVARQAMERALTGHSSSARRGHLLIDLSLVACAASLEGDQQAALDYCERAVELCERYGALLQRNYVLWTFALSAWRTGDHHRSYVLALEGAGMAETVSDQYIGAICIEMAAWYEAKHGDALRAAHLFGLAHGLSIELGFPILLWNTETPHAEGIAAAERALGPGRFWHAFRDGRRARLTDAIGWFASAPSSVVEGERPSLTLRQREIADLIAKGHTNKDIARLLLITVSTVETHIENIFAKLGVVSRAQVAAWTVGAGAAT